MRRRETRARAASSLVGLAGLGIAALACSGDDTAPAAPIADAGADAGIDAPADGSPNEAAADAGVDADPGWGAPFAIATSAGKDEDPSIIRAKDGTFYLAWYSNRDGNDRVWIMTSTDGLAWGTPRPITDASEHAFYPSLLQAKDGSFHLTWWAGEVGDGGRLLGRIRYASSNDTLAWSTPASLSDAAGLAWGATLAEPAPGKLFIVWSSDAGGDKDLYSVTSSNSGALWSTPVRRVNPSWNDDLPFVVARADGVLVMAWQRFDPNAKQLGDAFEHPTNEIVYAASADGTTWSTPIALTADAPSAMVPDVIPALFPSDDASGFSVAWSSVRLGATKGNVYAMGLSKAPATTTNVVQVTPDGDYGGRLVPLGVGGRTLLVWVKDLDIWARKL